MPNVMFLTESTSGLNSQWVSDFLGLFTQFVDTVFQTFPLNLMLVGALGVCALGVFGKGKRILH